MPHKITELGRDERVVWGTKYLFVGNHLLALVTAIQGQSTTHVADRGGHDCWGTAGFLRLTGSFAHDSQRYCLRLVDSGFDLSDATHPSTALFPSARRATGVCSIWWLPA